MELTLDNLLRFTTKQDASDLFIKANAPPMLRVYGDMVAMKADPRCSHIPVVIVSAKKLTEHPPKMQALDHLYEDYFVKPFELEALVGRLAELLTSQEAA